MNTPHPFSFPASGPVLRHGLSAAILALAGSPLWAATFTVNTLVDTINGGQGAGANGVGDLRYCLRRVNDSAQGQTHTIVFAPGLTGKITLNGSELVIRNNATITGPGADKLAIDADGKSRVLYIGGAPDVPLQVRISGLTMTGGNGDGKDPTGTDQPPLADLARTRGGAVLNHDSSLTLRDCSVTGNTSSVSDGGGGIFNYAENRNAILTLEGCAITGNSSPFGQGGGIWNHALNDNTSTLIASNCTISGNSSQGNGGGISSFGIAAVVRTELSHCSVTGNTSAGFEGGGGIWNSGMGSAELPPTTMVLTDCTVAGNAHTSSARGTAGDGGGGGILNGGSGSNGQRSVMTLRGCVVSGNTSRVSGGGLCNSGWLGRSELSLSQCVVHNNEADGSGAGISNFAYQGKAALVLSNCTIALNKALLRGGGIANQLDAFPYEGDETAVTVSGSTIAGNFAGGGGAGISSIKPQLNQDQTTVSLKLTGTLVGLPAQEGGNLLVTRGSNVSGGYNLCDDDTGAFLNQTGDKLETPTGLSSIIGENGLPVPVLQDNGGTTPTIALMAGSAAIDSGKATASPSDSTSNVLDQRGLARVWDSPGIPNAPGGDDSDIGAFEWNSPAITGWRYRYFGVTGNTGNASDQADPNHNGIPNLVEYALHGDPVSTAGGGVSLPEFTGGAGIPAQFTLTRYPDRPGTIMTVQAAGSLAGPWENVASSVDGMACQALAPGISVMETGPENSPSVIIAGFNPSLPRQFYRLRVESK
ncbi:hypothetical protein JIN84_07665 [Luteolibacter yonseiensis]|uniref:Right handed beta helix domain-containing protein n=1 Tax=Luteolibacter yonseiensis TaxID=1144680 RepID=A0A934R1Z4_9BACT|nr:choice-of-anchor Q domain-containing protein [Luteolibacter yonseiensis]MBK1815486.1 hypothetical protein [Luteolibacter yonseiensis]